MENEKAARPPKKSRRNKIIAAVLAAVFLIGMVILAVVAYNSSGWILDIGGAKIPEDVYIYYLDVSYSEARKLMDSDTAEGVLSASIDGKSGREWILDRTIEYCVGFVAANTEFKSKELSLTTAEKQKISDAVNGLWGFYSASYQSRDIKKPTLTKIRQNEAYKNSIFNFYFNTGGILETPEQDIKDYYSLNYAAALVIPGYYTLTNSQGERVEISGPAKKALKEKLEGIAVDVSGGVDIYEKYEEYVKTSEQISDDTGLALSIIEKEDSNYPAGFFKDIAGLEYNKATVLEYEDSIYVVLRQNEFGPDDEYFLEYREKCLWSLRNTDFEQLMEDIKGNYKTEVNNFTYNRINEKYFKER